MRIVDSAEISREVMRLVNNDGTTLANAPF
ncbi:hypothetical protein EYZ11_003882 [Aspergillus tanneri]|uniref:Uncharacterized protein n=1 Tax=Aspergillus tanneri TaxID=1220188 RepID=A0A4S3JM65_9EURO|nr:hypothetical protein EYZ11_003882 [Aspergillus tanneri]